VWAFNAWNLSYNVAHEFPDPAVRWKWIERSIRLLQSQGLKYNPGDPVIRKELTRIFLDRIGKRGDPAQAIFKQMWAETVMPYLHDGLREELESMQEVLTAGDNLFAEPDIAELVAAAAQTGIDARDPGDVMRVEDNDPRLAGLLDSPARVRAWQRVQLYARARGLEDDLGYSVSRMVFIDREYGPFDWRLSQAYAVYWAVGGELPFDDFLAGHDNQLYVMARQAMEQAFQAGRLIYDPKTGFFMVTNNLRIFGKVHDYYDKLLELNPSKNTHELHAEFLSEAAAILYSYQYVDAARTLYRHFEEDYAQNAGKRVPFETFISDNIYRVLQGQEHGDSQSTIHAALFQAYFWYAVGDARRAEGYQRMARLIYERHQRKYAGSPAFLLPPFDDLKQAALIEIRTTDLADFLSARLAGTPDVEKNPEGPAEESLYLGRFAEKERHENHGDEE
jgi:hypothetical protein